MVLELEALEEPNESIALEDSVVFPPLDPNEKAGLGVPEEPLMAGPFEAN